MSVVKYGVRLQYRLCSGFWQSYTSKVTFDATSDDVEELLDKTLVTIAKTIMQAKNDPGGSGGVLTTRKEALHLYRDILRASNLFVWKDERGTTWRDVIRDSARKEYEAARFETDPQIVTRLLVSGRDSLQQALAKFMAKREAIQREENQPLSRPQ